MCFGASFVFMHRVTDLSRSTGQLHVSLVDGRRVSARAVILATGASYRRLGVPAAGGADRSGRLLRRPGVGGSRVERQGRVHRRRWKLRRAGRAAPRPVCPCASRSSSVPPRSAAGMSPLPHRGPSKTRRTSRCAPRPRSSAGEATASFRSSSCARRPPAGRTTVAADALFVLIGARPHTDWLPGGDRARRHGFVLTGDELPDGDGWPLERRPLSLETSMPGVLAAGDVRHASVKRVASAVGEGSIAVQLVHSFLAADPQPAPPLEVA